MTNDYLDESSEDNILYELLIHTEWPQEPEVQGRGLVEKLEDSYRFENLWRWLGPLGPLVCPSIPVQKLRNSQLPWQFAVEGEGKVVAILQEQSLEIRSSRDEYGSILGRVTVDGDIYPHWRKITWSPDCTMIALSHSCGTVYLYDLIGVHLFTIPNLNFKPQGKTSSQNFGDAVSEMIFCDLRVKNTHWSYELLIIDYNGFIRSYFVSPTDGFQESHKFSVSSYYSNGISSVCYHRSTQLLIFSGKLNKTFSSGGNYNTAFRAGITTWRILLGHPYYKLSLSLEDEMVISKTYWWHMFPNFWRSNVMNEDLVYKMSISPNDTILATVHTSGALTLWDLPSLRLRKVWELSLQPNYSENNPQYCEPRMKKKFTSMMANILRYHLVDVNWWTDDAVILARSCGALTVSSIYSLKNLLGISPEWFEPSVQISPSSDKGFLAMECETFVTTKKRSSSELHEDMDRDSSDDEELSFFTKTASATKQVLYYVTDNDRFRPPRKKLKFVNRTYRLLCLKSTTPEELFARKINNEEYGEALALAKTYGLDSDLVYQKQWRHTPASVASIQDYLSKITKRAWVLHECVERVPETIDAAKELLMYGLCGTDLQAVITVGKNEDYGRFIIVQSSEEDDGDNDDEEYDEYSFEQAEKRKRKMEEKRAELLKQIDFSNLTLDQKQLCQCRLKLLSYLDRLTTYEAVLGGPGVADEFYDHNFFKKFRTQSGLEACINFAHESNWQAMAAMFTYHGKEALSHWLPILQNFPETTSANGYQVLLPKLSYVNGTLVVNPWNEDHWRVDDWCETKYQELVSSPVADDFIVDYYEEHRELSKYRDFLSPELLTMWCFERAHQIESESCLVDNALDFVKLCMAGNVQGLEKLLDNLLTLEALVYECNLDKDVTLKELEEMDDFEVAQLLMSKASEETVVKHVKQWLLPFLDRLEKNEAGSKKTLLKRYLVDASKDNLKFCRKILENSKCDHADPVVPTIGDQMSIAIECAYACERSDCLKDICAILENLSRVTTNRRNLSGIETLHKEMLDLEKHVRVAELLEKNKTPVTLGFIKFCSKNNEEMKKLLTKLTRFAGRRHPILDDAEWKTLLQDMLEIQQLLYICISVQECYEIYLQSLLCTGRQETIVLAGKMMECKKHSQKMAVSYECPYKLPYESSICLVLKASQEYFNSASTPSDPCIALAWSCLNLIEDAQYSIEDEKDLILGLKLLQEFNITILPLQVRLCSERLKFIEQALSQRTKAYKNSQKLLKLALLLRVCGDNHQEREGKVLSLIAETAFAKKDFEPCWKSCIQLMEGKHEEGWEVCFALGKCQEFSNVAAKSELLSFALSYCSCELMEDILKVKYELQLQGLADRIKFLVGDEEPTMQRESEADDTNATAGLESLWHTGEKTLQVLQNTTKTTKAVFSTVRKAHFWKDAVNWIKPSQRSWEVNSPARKKENKFINKEGICGFYCGLDEDSHISQLEASYQRYVRPDLPESVEIPLSIFQASMIENTIHTQMQDSAVDPTVMIDLIKSCLPEDLMWSLSLVFTLEQVDHVEKIFNDLPKTPIVLQLASLYYSLQISSYLGLSFLKSDENYFNPALIKQVMQYGKKHQVEIASNSVLQQAFDLLNKYDKMLGDFVQAELLHSIGGNVDAARFTADDVYKRETILGIAMTSDEEVFHTAVSLANNYNLPVWDVYMAQLEHLFAENRANAAHVEEKMKKLKLLKILLKNPKLFREKLEQCVYPCIDGKNHAMLLSYFSLLELCGDAPGAKGLKPVIHTKLLSKFRACAKGLDYKLFIKGGPSFLSHLSSVLNDSNVHVFAKVATKIPSEKASQFYEPSTIYCLWLKKYFFRGSGPSFKMPKSTIEWSHHFESCESMLKRLNPSDVLQFVDSIVFTDVAFEKLSVTCRAGLIKQALSFCRQKTFDNGDDKEIEPKWCSIILSLQKYSQHLQRVQDPIFTELWNDQDPKTVSYAKAFDLSQSDPDKLRNLLAKTVIEGPDLSVLKTLLACCPAEVDWQPSDAYMHAIRQVIDNMRAIGEEPLELSHTIEVLERIVEDISKNNDDLMVDDMAVYALYCFCQDATVCVTTRLQVLQVLKNTAYFSEEYSSLLLLYQTQAVVSSICPNFEVSEEEISDEAGRSNLFYKLIPFCSTVGHFSSLSELLCHWPLFGSGASEAWTLILCGLAALPGKEGLDRIVSLLEKANLSNSLNLESCQKIYQEVLRHGSILHTLKFAFKTKYSEMRGDAICRLKQRKNFGDEECDDELLSLVLEQHLTTQIVGTSLYQPVTRYLLEKQDDSNRSKNCFVVNNVVKELYEAGYKAEAGSLMMINNRTHTGLATFSSAFNVLKNWMSK